MSKKTDNINIFKFNLFSYNIKITNENKHDKDEYKTYCINNNILGWGWVFCGNSECGNSLDVYYQNYKDDKIKKGEKCTSLTKAYKQIKCMKEGDYVWTCVKGEWYLGKISGDFNFHSPEGYPEFGMLRGCVWKPITNQDLIPGNILTYSRNDRTVRCVETNDSFIQYCQYLYGDLSEEPKNLNFWDLVHYEDLEDIVGLYLQKEKDYLVYPSTNKMGTKDYEYMLVQKTEPYKTAIIQCKNNSCIGEDNWEKFERGEEYKGYQIYILTVKEDKHPKEKYSEYPETEMFRWSFDNRIFVFNKNKLKEWAKTNSKILPQRIEKYLNISI